MSASTAVTKVFPGALKNADLVSMVTKALQKYGYGASTLLATSFCSDEVNRELDRAFGEVYGYNFSMGGLSGFPFGGVTSFGAMAHHIPDGGSCLVVYGPHVGIDNNGTVGMVNRRGREASGACCGSAAAAAAYVSGVHSGKMTPQDPPDGPFDAQQTFVGSLLLPYAKRLANAPDPDMELPYALYDSQTELMQKIVAAGCGEVAGDGKIAVLGGIQINTAPTDSDYYLPLSFEVRDNKGDLLETIISGTSQDG